MNKITLQEINKEICEIVCFKDFSLLEEDIKNPSNKLKIMYKRLEQLKLIKKSFKS